MWTSLAKSAKKEAASAIVAGGMIVLGTGAVDALIQEQRLRPVADGITALEAEKMTHPEKADALMAEKKALISSAEKSGSELQYAFRLMLNGFQVIVVGTSLNIVKLLIEDNEIKKSRGR